MFPPLKPNCKVSFAGSILASCHFRIGYRQVGVLAPQGVTVVAAPGPFGHIAFIWDVGVNLILSYLFIYLEYLDRLAQFGF